MSDIVSRAILKDEMSPKLKNIQGQLDKTNKTAQKTSKGSKEFSGNLGGAAKSAGLLKASLVGLAAAGVGAFAKSLVSASAEMETLETKFKVLLGDTESAKARMQELSKFASTTPFQLTEIANASRVLQTLGGTALATGDSLRLVGDASAISGESFENLAVHIGRAYSGLSANRPIGESLARLQELGLVSGETRNEIEDLTKSAQGQKAWKVLQKELQKSQGGMKTLSQTFSGLSSTLKDQFQESLRQISNSGFFDAIKDGLTSVVDIMGDMIQSGVFRQIGAGLSIVVNSFQAMFNVVDLAVTGIVYGFSSMVKNIVQAANFLVSKLPNSLVPKEWKQSLNEAQVAVETFDASITASMGDVAENLKNNMIQASDSFDDLLNGIDVKSYKERIQEKKDADNDDADNQAKALERQKQARLDHQQTMADIERDAYEVRREASLLILSEDDRMREELRRRQQERIAKAGETEDLILLHKKESADLEAQIEKKKTDYLEKQADQRKAIRMAELGLFQTITSSMSTIAQNALGKSKKNAGIRKGIALSEALINTSLGVTKALASSPPPLNFINAAAVGASGAAQVSTIASQKFAQGGIVKGQSGVSDIGDKTLVRVNAGEGVFTKDQMKALGGMMGTTTIAPNITINGNADGSTIAALENTLEDFASKWTQAVRDGVLDPINELNLVTA
jgi:hypothetical protein